MGREAAKEFEAAKQEAWQHGLILRTDDGIQYQLERRRKWMMNIYPGTRRIYNASRCRGLPDAPPYLNLGVADDDFSLLTVVRAAVAKDAKWNQTKGKP